MEVNQMDTEETFENKEEIVEQTEETLAQTEQRIVTDEERMDELYKHLYEQMHVYCCCEQMKNHTMEVAPLDMSLEDIKDTVQFVGVSVIRDPFPDTVLIGKWEAFNFCPFCGKRAILGIPYTYIGPDAPRLAGLLVNLQ